MKIKIQQKKVAKILDGILIGCLLLGLGLVGLAFVSNDNPVLSAVLNKMPLNPTLFPTETPFPTDTSVDTSKVTQTPNQTNADPVVHCQLSACGVVDMSKSQCSISGCCAIGNQYIVMTDQNKCLQDQQAYAQSHQMPVQQSNNTNDPVMTCTLTEGTYQLPESVCQMYQEADLNSQDNTLHHAVVSIPPPPTLAPPPQIYMPQAPNGSFQQTIPPTPTNPPYCALICDPGGGNCHTSSNCP